MKKAMNKVIKMKNIKAFCLLFVFAFSMLLPLGVLFDGVTHGQEQNCAAIATQCFLYTTPQFSDQEHDRKVKDDEGKDVFFENGDILALLSGGEESDDFLYVTGEKGGKTYAGYVYKYLVSFNLQLEQQVYPQFNAKVAVDNAVVFDLDGQPTEFKLSAGQRLYLYKGYQKKEEKTPVCFVDGDGKLYYGYLNTKDLEPDGISGTVVTGVVVAASCITIILLLVFMKKRKKDKKKDKKNKKKVNEEA